MVLTTSAASSSEEGSLDVVVEEEDGIVRVRAGREAVGLEGRIEERRQGERTNGNL